MEFIRWIKWFIIVIFLVGAFASFLSLVYSFGRFLVDVLISTILNKKKYTVEDVILDVMSDGKWYYHSTITAEGNRIYKYQIKTTSGLLSPNYVLLALHQMTAKGKLLSLWENEMNGDDIINSNLQEFCDRPLGGARAQFYKIKGNPQRILRKSEEFLWWPNWLQKPVWN